MPQGSSTSEQFQPSRPAGEGRASGAGYDIDEQRFRAAMHHSAIGMALLAPDGSWLDVNDALCRIVGYEREELTRLTFQDITHPDDLQADLENMRHVLEGRIETYQMDKRYFHKNGAVVWIQLNVSLTRHGDGTPSHFISQIQDITARKQVERVMETVSGKLQFLEGPQFYATAAEELASVLDAEIAYIGRVDASRPDTLHTLAVVRDGRLVENFSYPLEGTPCAEVVEGMIHVIEDDAQSMYPRDSYLVEQRIRACAATPLMGPDGRVFGHLGVLKREPFPNREAIAQTLNTFALAVSSHMTREANRRQYQDLFEMAPDGLLMTDRCGRIFEANRQAQAMFALGREAICRRNVRDLLSLADDDGSDPWRGFLETTRPRQPSLGRGGFQALREDGTTTPVELNLNPMETDEGSRLVISIRNIAERLQNQRALRLRDQAIDAAGVGMMIISSARDGLRVLDVNYAFETITGRARDEVVGKAFDAVLGESGSSLEIDTIRSAIRHEMPAFALLRGHRRNGKPFWTEVSISPVADEDGDEIKFVGIVNDVTDRIDTEQKLRLMADALPVLLVYFDKHDRFRMVNRTAEQWYARPAVEFIGKSAEDVLDPAHVDAYRSRTADAPADTVVKFESRYTYPDGKTRTTEIHHIPHVDADGEVAGHYTMAIDITERENVRAHLNQAQRMESIGQLSGGVAHDFNNLLSVIQGNLQLLSRRREIAEDGAMGRWVESALDAVGRGADLTQRLLAFSRRQPLENTVIDVAGHLAEMRVLLQRAVGELVEIKTDIEDGLPCIEGDLSQFENAVLNLAVNARDAMPRGGTVVIDAYRARLLPGDASVHPDLPPGDYVMVAVRDEGVGMTADERERAFEPFFTTKEPGRGTGLGLASVFGYVKQCGGHVTIDSEPGRGTTVRLCFPVCAQVDRVARKKPAGRSARMVHGAETILAVDDNREVLAAGAELLRSIGYEVLEAENGARALEVLEENGGVDLVFTDMVMPGGMNGLELAEQIRAKRPDLPILFTSGYAEEAMRRAGAAISRSEWIHKPVDIEELEVKIVDLLDSSMASDRELDK